MVAAENFYGDIARQIGGDRVAVVSIMNSPDQDPHLFETTPGIVRQIAGAQVAVFNGADYDPWMEKAAAAPRRGRGALEIIVAARTWRTVHAGDNPHLWYDPATMRGRRPWRWPAAFSEGGPRACRRTMPARLDGDAGRARAHRASGSRRSRPSTRASAVTASEPVFGLHG